MFIIEAERNGEWHFVHVHSACSGCFIESEGDARMAVQSLVEENGYRPEEIRYRELAPRRDLLCEVATLAARGFEVAVTPGDPLSAHWFEAFITGRPGYIKATAETPIEALGAVLDAFYDPHAHWKRVPVRAQAERGAA